METCLLCLQTPSLFDQTHGYIPINSQKWLRFDLLDIIEKHFWSIDDLENCEGICYICWSKLNEFHTFYRQIEEAHHRTAGILKTEKINNSAYKSCFVLPDTNITSGKLDIKIEDSLDEYESIFCAPEMSTSSVNYNENSVVAVEKRKRGRPRKYPNTQEMLVKQPKRKPGRPRKEILDSSGNMKTVCRQKDPCNSYSLTVIRNRTLPNVLNSTTQSSLTTTKKSRGRPRKIQNDNIIKSTECEVSQECNIGQAEVPKVSINEDKNMVKKGQTHLSLMKKRKSVKHKALMRNYIAASVRCMQFFKK